MKKKLEDVFLSQPENIYAWTPENLNPVDGQILF
jgi:hypothetical protein